MKIKTGALQLLLLITLLSTTACPSGFKLQVEEINSHEITNSNTKIYAQFPKTKSMGIVWDKHPVNLAGVASSPVLPTNLAEPLNIFDPTVLKVADNDYRMWVTQLIEPVNNGDPEQYRIGYIKSTDGIVWQTPIDISQNVPLPAQTPNMDTKICSIIETEGNTHKYRMYYLGRDATLNNGRWTLYYAYTEDLMATPIVWKTERFATLQEALKPTDKMFDQDGISRVSVVKGKDMYHMWYGGFKNGLSKIGYASSPGGKTKWKKGGALISPGFAAQNSYTFDSKLVDFPYVLKNGDVYMMWYSGYNLPWSIGLAYSLDGKEFSFYDNQFDSSFNNPVLRPEEGWEGRGIKSCSIILDRDSSGAEVYKMWYTAEGNDKKCRIGYAESRYAQDEL